jgi:O-antigen ligase
MLMLRFFHWKTLLAGLLGGLLLAIVMPASIQKRALSVFDAQDPSNYARLAIWKAGIKMVQAHPWTGIGPQRIYKVFYDYDPHSEDLHRSGFFPVHMHNNLLQYAAERGIPCALAWLWLILRIAVDHWRMFWKGPQEKKTKALAAMGLASLVALFIAGLFEFNFGDSEVLILALFLLVAPYTQPYLKATQ